MLTFEINLIGKSPVELIKKMKKQIITLQCGHYANYIGAHYWNMQEEYILSHTNVVSMEIDADMLFREGQTSKV